MGPDSPPTSTQKSQRTSGGRSFTEALEILEKHIGAGTHGPKARTSMTPGWLVTLALVPLQGLLQRGGRHAATNPYRFPALEKYMDHWISVCDFSVCPRSAVDVKTLLRDVPCAPDTNLPSAYLCVGNPCGYDISRLTPLRHMTVLRAGKPAGLPNVDSVRPELPFLSFLGTFPILRGSFPIGPFWSFSSSSACFQDLQGKSRKDPGHNQEFSRKDRETPWPKGSLHYMVG